MKIAIVDNGSLAPDSHRGLRAVAEALERCVGEPVDAVSWKHSDRIPQKALGDRPAQTLAPWIRAQVARGERDFLFVPFFVSPQGAIGSALHRDLERLSKDTGGFRYRFSAGLSAEALGTIASARIRQALSQVGRRGPAVIVVDHGGPAPTSAAVRNRIADFVRAELQSEIGTLAAASMESPTGDGFAFNRPLLEDQLGAPGFDRGDVVIAPLFLLPGRHAGPAGDLARIVAGASSRFSALRVHFASLIGDHPFAIESLARTLREILPEPAFIPS